MLAAAAVLAATAVGVFAEGGYAPAARVAFSVAALAACVAVRPPARAWRDPLVGVLLALALLGTASALWTVGLVGEALRWGFVTAGFAGLAACAAVAPRRPLAAGLAVIAAITAAMGLVSAALGDPAFAVRIAGSWRPGGPFEYPPALALAQVSVLPILIAALRSGSRALAAAGAVGVTLALAVLVLAESRTALALGIVVAGVLVVPRRPSVLAAVAAVAVVAGVLAFGPAAGRGAGPPTDFLHGRGATWEAAVNTFAERPVQGAGADAFLAASARHQEGKTILFAHNLPLEAAVELGVPGALLVLALYAFAARLLWARRATEAGRLFGPAVAVFLVAGLLDWPWHLAGSGAMWAVAAGALMDGGRVRHQGVRAGHAPPSE